MMKKIVLIFCVVLLFLLPLSASGEDKKNYVALKPGLYTFDDRLRDADFRTGFLGELVYGYYLLPNFVLEGGTGYFHDGVNKSYGNSIKGIPVFLTAKAVYLLKKTEFLAGGGIGVYFTKLHAKVNGVLADERDTVFGVHLSLGANYNISPAVFIGLEGKYLFTEKADFSVLESRLNGHTITVNFGFRF
jgi:opacity protein-like surface antigen